MHFIETSRPLTPKLKSFAKLHPTRTTIDENRTSFDQQMTIPLDSKDRGECRYCLLKQQLAPSLTKYCLSHSVTAISKNKKQYLNDYLPTCQQLANTIPKPQVQAEDLSAISLIRQAEDLHQNIKVVHGFLHGNDPSLQNQLILTLNKCIDLLKREPIRFEERERDNNTSYTISLQLDVSNQMTTEWLRASEYATYPHIEQEGLKPMMDDFLNHLSEWNMKKASDYFLKVMDAVQQKLDFNHSMLKQYQMSLSEMNKRLLNHIEKPVSNFKQLQDDLNFIEHISSLGQMTSRNINMSNNSSVMLKKKYFDDHELQNDLLKFVVLQASALEKILPEILNEELNSFD